MSTERRTGTGKTDVRLSYSSSELLANCTQKYAHKKILGTPVDADVEEDQKAFNIGKAFHQVIELAKHDTEPTIQMVKRACKTHEVLDDQALIHAMSLKYFKLHKKSKLTCVATEFEIANDIFIGYVDAVLTDAKGNWWVTDLKTASSVQETKLARLHSDVQLNLYSRFHEMMAKMFKLDPKKFAGARYRVTTKSKIKPLKDEMYQSYVKRLFSSIDSLEVVLPKAVLDWEKAYRNHHRLFRMSMAMREGKYKPRQNFWYCDSYFKPCEYWSACHGGTFSELKEKLKIEYAD